MLKMTFFQVVGGVAWCLAVPIASSQDAYPERPVKIVVPYPPGGATDIVVRVYAAGLTELLGQQFIVENRAGGGTNIGASYVARSAPDGYTLYAANFASNAVNKWLYKKLSYDPEKDFAAAVYGRARLSRRFGGALFCAGCSCQHRSFNSAKIE